MLSAGFEPVSEWVSECAPMERTHWIRHVRILSIGLKMVH